MNKQNAVINYRKTKVVEKAVLLNKSIQLRIDFSVSCSVWIPVAKQNKPMPQIVLTMNVGTEGVSFNANNTEDIVKALYNMAVFLEKNEQHLNQTVEEQRDKWLEMAEGMHRDCQQMKVVKMESKIA
jgi:hypothetical protein